MTMQLNGLENGKKFHLIVQPPGLRHGRQRRPFTTDVSKDLINHETEEEEVEAGADPGHNDERHLKKSQSGKPPAASEEATVKKIRLCDVCISDRTHSQYTTRTISQVRQHTCRCASAHEQEHTLTGAHPIAGMHTQS